MCNLYSVTTNQEAIRALFRVMNRYVGNLPAMPGVFPDYPAPVVRNAGAERELVLMRWGMPPPLRTGWAASDQHPQHVIAALARLAEARKPMPGAFQQLCRVCARAEPRDKKRTSSGSRSMTIGR
jgi:putative SOS response-associated peptidase YedK